MSSNVFYNKFERHAHGEGLKGHSTHYCAGCGHGLVHKYIAEAIEALDIQDRTIAISPVGCAVFLYYYLDVGNSQAAHGRAPAVALGHKMANPESIVISYQGDGDLASIGLAEIMQAAQMGIPLSVIFVNNAIYGMTGGQMAPTTLMGTKTATTPFGRERMMGTPLKMAEIIAQMDGPIFVQRCALYDNKQRTRTQKAINKALRLQKENKGFSFVEILSECPTHLKIRPEEAETWVKENMEPVFPLGVLKDEDPEPWFEKTEPSFDAQLFLDTISAESEQPKRFMKDFPAHIDAEDIAIKMAGAGGDGAQTAAMLLTRSAINEGFDATHIPSYGPESRGGTSYADVHIAKSEVLSPASPEPHILVAFNAPSLAKFGPAVKKNGLIVYDSSVISEEPQGLDPSLRVVGVPFSGIALEIGKLMVKNIVALGALCAASNIMPQKSFLTAIHLALKDKKDMLPLNEEAFQKGMDAVKSEEIA